MYNFTGDTKFKVRVFSFRSTSRVILGQVHSIVTCGSRSYTMVNKEKDVAEIEDKHTTSPEIQNSKFRVFTFRSKARVILGQVHSIVTCGSRSYTRRWNWGYGKRQNDTEQGSKSYRNDIATCSDGGVVRGELPAAYGRPKLFKSPSIHGGKGKTREGTRWFIKREWLLCLALWREGGISTGWNLNSITTLSPHCSMIGTLANNTCKQNVCLLLFWGFSTFFFILWRERWLVREMTRLWGHNIYLFIWGFTSLSTLYRSYHDG